MSELNIKIRKVQDNGSAFKANPDTLYLGGMRSAKVDRLHFEVPEEWKACTISLHVQRLSGTLPDPQILDENNSVLVDRRWTLEAQGRWMLLAMDENGYIAMSKPGQYTCYETIDTDSTTETLTPSIYEQFVAQVTSWANQAKESMNAAAGSAKKAGEEADRAEQAVADLDQTRTDSIKAVQDAQSTATTAVEQKKTDAVQAVGNKLTKSLGELDTAKGTALDEVADATQEAKNAAAASKASAEKSASEAAKAESSAGAAKTSEGNSKTSEEAAAESKRQAAVLLKAVEEYYSQVRTITIGAMGWYATPEDLAEKNPIGEDGWWGVVGTTDTIWTWDSDTSAWVDPSAKTTLGDYQSRDQVIDLLAGKADVDHTHAWGAITGKPSSFPPEAHTHDDRYYTESEMDSKLNAKANSSHSHNYAGSNSAGGTANSVNGFTFSAQTGDPGAWSNLGTNRVLLVYE